MSGERPSTYGRAFDDLAEQWATLEAGHDLVHPDRSQCGGVGACPAMRLAVDLEQSMIKWLEEWRVRR